MTVWILQQQLMADEEERIAERQHLPLPFGDMSDLSRMANQGECRKLLRVQHPDEPPESIALKADRVWKIYEALHVDDIIAVPLKNRGEMALAKMSGHYRFADGVHQIPISWYPERVAFSKLSRHRELFAHGGGMMFEVTSPEARIALRDKLPHSYNRFAKWKWLLIIFFGLSALRLIHQLIGW